MVSTVRVAMRNTGAPLQLRTAALTDQLFMMGPLQKFILVMPRLPAPVRKPQPTKEIKVC